MPKNKNNPQISFLQEIQRIAPTLLEEKVFEIKFGVVISDSVKKNLEDLDLDRNAELEYGSKIKRETGELETFIIENCPELIQQKQDSLYRLGGEVGKLFGALDTQSEARKKALESLTKDFIKTASYIKIGKKIPEDNFLQMHPVTTMEGEEQSGSKKERSGVVNNSGGGLGYLKVLLGITALASVAKDEAAPHLDNKDLLIDESFKFGVNKNVPIYARGAVGQDPENPKYQYSLASTLLDLGKNKEALPHLQKAVDLDPIKGSFKKLSRESGQQKEKESLNPKPTKKKEEIKDDLDHKGESLEKTKPKKKSRTKVKKSKKYLSQSDQEREIISAAENNQLRKFVSILKSGFDHTQHLITGSTIAHHVVAVDNVKMIEALHAKRGVEVFSIQDKAGTTPLYMAAEKNKTKSAKKLLKLGVNATQSTKDGFTPAHLAAEVGNVIIIEALFNAGGVEAISKENEDGITPLYIAAEKNKVKSATKLLKLGVNATQSTKEGFTPAHIAAEVGNVKIIEALFNAGGVEAISKEYKDGMTPLYIAAEKNKVKSATKLLKLGVNATQSTKEGFTPAHVAATFGNVKIIEALFEAGGFEAISQKENSGKTPLDRASIAGHKEVEELLSSYTKKHQQQKQQEQQERDSQAPEEQQQKQQKSDNGQDSQSLKEPQKQQERDGQQNSQPLEEEQQKQKKQEGSNQQDSQSSYAVPLAATIAVAVAGYVYMLKGKLKQEKEEKAVLRERLAGLQRNSDEQKNGANEQKDQLREGLQGQIDKLKNVISAKDQELAAIAEEKELSDSLAEKLGRQSKVLKKELDKLKAKQNLNSQEGIPWIPEWVQDKAGNLPVDFDKFVSTIPQDFDNEGIDHDDLKALSSLLKRINIEDLIHIRNIKNNVDVAGSSLTQDEYSLFEALKSSIIATVDQANYGVKNNTSSAHLALRYTLISLRDKGKFPNLKEEQEEAAKKANQDLEGKEDGETTSKAFKIHPLQVTSSAAAKPSSKARRRGRNKKASRLNDGGEGKEGHNNEGGRN